MQVPSAQLSGMSSATTHLVTVSQQAVQTVKAAVSSLPTGVRLVVPAQSTTNAVPTVVNVSLCFVFYLLVSSKEMSVLFSIQLFFLHLWIVGIVGKDSQCALLY